MRVKVTDEMRAVYLLAWGASGCSVKAGLEAVLKIVEREHWKQVEAAFYEGYDRGYTEGYDQGVKDATE